MSTYSFCTLLTVDIVEVTESYWPDEKPTLDGWLREVEDSYGEQQRLNLS